MSYMIHEYYNLIFIHCMHWRYYVLPISVHPAFGFCSITCFSIGNHLKLIHKVMDYQRKAKFNCWIYNFLRSWVMHLFMLARSVRSVSYGHIFIFLLPVCNSCNNGFISIVLVMLENLIFYVYVTICSCYAVSLLSF